MPQPNLIPEDKLEGAMKQNDANRDGKINAEELLKLSDYMVKINAEELLKL